MRQQVTGDAGARICQNAGQISSEGAIGMHEGPSKEEKILRMLKRVLTDIAKDTSTPPGMKHPLSENTIQSIRDCLGLISAREKELADESGRPSQSRPEFVDEPNTTPELAEVNRVENTRSNTQVVTLHRTPPGVETVDRVGNKRSKKPNSDKPH